MEKGLPQGILPEPWEILRYANQRFGRFELMALLGCSQRTVYRFQLPPDGATGDKAVLAHPDTRRGDYPRLTEGGHECPPGIKQAVFPKRSRNQATAREKTRFPQCPHYAGCLREAAYRNSFLDCTVCPQSPSPECVNRQGILVCSRDTGFTTTTFTFEGKRP